MNLLTIAVAAALAASTATADEAMELRMLRAELSMLRAQVKKQAGEIARLKAELAAARRPASAETDRSDEGTVSATGYTYRTRQVSPVWFERHYKEFADKIVELNGKFYDVGKDIAEQSCMWKEPPPVGSLRYAAVGHFRKATVFQTLANGAAIIEVSMSGIGVPARSIFIHVKGLPGNLVDESRFPHVPLVYVGPFTYTATAGSPRTIQGYRVYQPLSRPRFAAALAGGFELVRYRRIKKRVREGGGTIATGFSVQKSKPRWVTKHVTDAKPIP